MGNDITITTSKPPVKGLDSHYYDDPETLCNPFASEKLRRRSGIGSPHLCYELGPGYHGHPYGSIVVTDGDEWVVWDRTSWEFKKFQKRITPYLMSILSECGFMTNKP